MKNEKLLLTFAGQAGFILENADGYRIGIDLYLSNCCERYFGFKRLLPYIFNPLELNLDLIVASHAHYDHFDRDSVPLMMENPKTKLLCAYDVLDEVESLNLDKSRITFMKREECFEFGDFKIEALACDHGELSKDAVALLITVSNKKIYIAGDTAYHEEYFKNPKLADLDVMIIPINGQFGNMNEKEGAKASELVNPKLTIPCHFWNFAEHGGNPYLFCEEMKNGKNLPYLLMRAGETYEF